MASLLYDLLWGEPEKPEAGDRGGAEVHTGADGSMFIDTNDLRDEPAFLEQIRDFADVDSEE